MEFEQFVKETGKSIAVRMASAADAALRSI
jgi:hypothetical protein